MGIPALIGQMACGSREKGSVRSQSDSGQHLMDIVELWHIHI